MHLILTPSIRFAPTARRTVEIPDDDANERSHRSHRFLEYQPASGPIFINKVEHGREDKEHENSGERSRCEPDLPCFDIDLVVRTRQQPRGNGDNQNYGKKGKRYQRSPEIDHLQSAPPAILM